MDEGLRICGFADAAAEAFALSEQFRRAHGAALFDIDGSIIDMTIFAAPHHTPDDALTRASDVLCGIEFATRLILFSIGADGVETPRETDISRFSSAIPVFADRRCQLIDHLLCDGDKIRSLAFTTGARTWDENGLPADPHVR